jgi:hypothetical protein
MVSEFVNELGALPPTGFWDPLGISNTADKRRFDYLRARELKHGRVAMAAVLGYIVQEVCRLPGYLAPGVELKFADVPNGLAALGVVPILGWAQMILFVWWLETAVFIQKEGELPGTFGVGYFGRDLEGDEKEEKLTKELQNGRLAMLGILEILTHDYWRPSGEGLFVLHHF